MIRKMIFGERSLVRSQSIEILSIESVLSPLVWAALALVLMNCASTASAATLQVATVKLPVGYLGLAYSAKLTATGGSGAGYTWSISTGALPTGLTLAPTTGVISGKPIAKGVTALTLRVKDSAANTATAKLSLTVDLPLSVSTSKLATGYLNITYSATLAATGGSSTGYKWSIATGTLPQGLSLAAATGIISGKPTATGSSAITVKVTDSLANTATAKLILLVNPDLSVTTAKLAGAFVGTVYKATLAASGGSGSGDTWTISAGTLPAGLTLAAATGVISGTATTAGTSTFSVSVKDSASNTATASLKLIVGPQLVITPATLPVGYLATNYTFTFNATGGSGTGLVWTTKSTLPQNMVLSKAGVLSGPPQNTGPFTLTIVVTDSAKNTASAEFPLVINSTVAQCTNDHQTTTLIELHGLYTFTLNRRNLSNGQLFNTIGSFNADGLGNILNGVMDSNGPEFTAELQNTFTGTYTIGSDGRGGMDITIPSTGIGKTSLSQSFCFALDTYAINGIEPPYNEENKSTTYGASTHAFVIEDDTSNVASSGEFLAQTVNPTNVIMNGSWAFALAGRVHYPTILPNGPDPRVTFVGYISCDGNGNITAGKVDEDLSLTTAGKIPNPSYSSQKTLVGTYSIPIPSSGTPTGRGTTSLTHNGTQFVDYVFYPNGSSGFVALVVSAPASATPVHLAWTGVGARRTSTSFSTASLKGSSVASQYFIENPGLSNESEGVGIDVDQWDGSGSFTYTGDRNSASVASTVSGSGTYTVDANGRFAVMVNGLCAPCGYLSGPNQGFAIYDSANTALVTLDAQTVPVGGPFQIASMQGGYAVGSRWYVFPRQQTVSGETISDGQGNFRGTFDTNTEGQTDVDLNLTALETATSNSGVHGRFLYQPSNTAFPYAIYVIDKNNAVAIPLGGSNSETETLLRFIHQ